MAQWQTLVVELPTTGRKVWLVVDESYTPHQEVRAFVTWMLGRGMSMHTHRVYTGRLARFLNWADRSHTDWKQAQLLDMTRYKLHLQATTDSSQNTIDASLGTVATFLRFCGEHGLIESDAVKKLFEKREFRYPPPSIPLGERPGALIVSSRVVRAKRTDSLPRFLSGAELEKLIGSARSPRDRLLIEIMGLAGLRVGECLGLHRQDLHLLPNSRALGCDSLGPHLHVVHRENSNDARAKGGRSRMVPLPQGVITSYQSYYAQLDSVPPEALDTSFLFVDLRPAFIGTPLTYWQANQIVRATGKIAGLNVAPHMLRHTAATRWIRADVPRDIVQSLLGHMSYQSTSIYLHASDEDLREAVERGNCDRDFD